MSDRVLSKMGIYVDEMTSKLRLIDPDAKRFTTALLDNSEDFTEMGKIFVSDLSDILNASSKLASLVEEAKIEAIGYRASIQKEIDDGEDEEKEVQLLLQRKKAEVNQKQMYLDSLLQQKREKIDKIHHSCTEKKMIRRSPTRIELKLEDIQEFEYVQKADKKRANTEKNAEDARKLLRHDRIGYTGPATAPTAERVSRLRQPSSGSGGSGTGAAAASATTSQSNYDTNSDGNGDGGEKSTTDTGASTVTGEVDITNTNITTTSVGVGTSTPPTPASASSIGSGNSNTQAWSSLSASPTSSSTASTVRPRTRRTAAAAAASVIGDTTSETNTTTSTTDEIIIPPLPVPFGIDTFSTISSEGTPESQAESSDRSFITQVIEESDLSNMSIDESH